MSVEITKLRSPDTLAHKLARESFGIERDQLTIDGFCAADLAQEYGTPLFVYSARKMRQSLRTLRHATHQQADIHYSVKVNPNPAVIRTFAREDTGAEIASGGEFNAAREAGVPADRIIFAGPGKSSAELEQVIAGGIGEIHAEAVDELERISVIARQRTGRPINISLRVNPTEVAQGGSMRMGGKPAPFGIDEEQLPDVIERFKREPALNICGVHLFAGTQILEADVLLKQWRHGLSVAGKVAGMLERDLDTIDLGGGLGIQYFAHESALELQQIRQEFPALLQQCRDTPGLAKSRIIIEPGRFLAGPAGVYLCRVVSLKTSRGVQFAVTDGGMHHHLAATGNLGQVIKRDFPIMLAGRATAAHDQPVTVVGPLCTPLDTLARKTPLPKLALGDVVAVLQSGAYGLTASPNGFLSQPTPAEIQIDNDSVSVIRERAGRRYR